MSALDGWPAVEPWLCRRSRELVITRTWCTVTARKTTTAITTSWPLNTRSAARAIRIPEPNCSSLTLSAPESAERDATAGSTVSLSIPPGRRRRLHLQAAPSLRLALALAPNVGGRSVRIAEFVSESGFGDRGSVREITLLNPSTFLWPACISTHTEGFLFFAPNAPPCFRRLDTTLCARRRRGAREAGGWQRWPD